MPRFIQIITLFLLLTACDSASADHAPPAPTASMAISSTPLPAPTHGPATPTKPAISAREQAMYQAVLAAFFGDGGVQRLLQPDLLRQKVLYLQPTFTDTKLALPTELVELVATHATSNNLAIVAQEQSGGAMLTLSSIGSDPDAAIVYHRRGPTIQIGFFISAGICGSSIGRAYLLTPKAGDWEAQYYLTAVC